MGFRLENDQNQYAIYFNIFHELTQYFHKTKILTIIIVHYF